MHLCLKTFQVLLPSLGPHFYPGLCPYSSQRWAWSKGGVSRQSARCSSAGSCVHWGPGSGHTWPGQQGKTDSSYTHTPGICMKQVRDQNYLWSKDRQVRGSGLEWADRGERPGGGFVNTQLNFWKPWGGQGQPDWAPFIHSSWYLPSWDLRTCVDSYLFRTFQLLEAAATVGTRSKELYNVEHSSGTQSPHIPSVLISYCYCNKLSHV